MNKPEKRSSNPRTGFSLLEVLIVIGLIAFLTAAIVVIMPRVGNAAKVSATQATIKKVDELLNDRINGFVRWIQTQNTQAGNNPPAYVLNAPVPPGLNANQYQQNQALFQILAAKYFFRKYFPQNFDELGMPHAPNRATESAACLYLILTQASVFDTDPLAAADLKGLEVADTDNDGHLEIVDAWGQPLRYYRWPTRLFRPFTPSPPITGVTVSTPYWHNLEPAPAPTPASLLVTTATRGPIPQWTSGSYSVGQTIQPATIVQNGVPNVMMYQCTVAGTSGTSEPNPWGTSAGSTTGDGGVTWQAVLDPLAVDGDDPNGLASSNFVNETGLQYYHTWATYHIPLIVSCGTDGLLGLFEPWDANNFGTLAQPQFDPTDTTGLARSQMYDNITNHQK